MLAGPVGWNQPNVPPDVLLIQRIVNIVIDNGYLDELLLTQLPDGASYRGRGFVQLTGRSNYAQYGKELSWPLEDRPELGNDPWVAAVLLADFLKAHEQRIRDALRLGHLAVARRTVNGGTNGLDAFTKSMRAGQAFMKRHLAAGAMARAAGAAAIS